MILAYFRFRGWNGPERPVQIHFLPTGMAQLAGAHKHMRGQLQRQPGKPKRLITIDCLRKLANFHWRQNCREVRKLWRGQRPAQVECRIGSDASRAVATA